MPDSPTTRQAQPSLRECESALRAAQLTGDVAALERLIDDTLMFTGPDGALYGKSDDLDAHRRGSVQITRLEPSEEQIRQYGSVAVVSVRMEMAGSWRGVPFAGSYRYTRVWRDGGQGWRVVAGQVGAVLDGPEPGSEPLVAQATTPEQLDEVRALIRSFLQWHRERHQEDLHLIEAYFDAAEFEAELAGLPGKYSPPRGSLLLATVGGRPAGCVALREISEEACEMKRMFVYPEMRGHGVGRALGEAVIREARAAGYVTMLLDTSFRQSEAQTLYRRLGFREIEPYYPLPDELRSWLVFMSLQLGDAPPRERR